MTKTILAFDFGEKRIGVAVGNTITKTAEALKIIQEKNQDAKFKAIEALIQEWQPQLLVVGLPTHPDGAEHEMTQKAKRFGNQLHGTSQGGAADFLLWRRPFDTGRICDHCKKPCATFPMR